MIRCISFSPSFQGRLREPYAMLYVFCENCEGKDMELLRKGIVDRYEEVRTSILEGGDVIYIK